MPKVHCSIARHPQFEEALARMNQVTPIDEWPPDIVRLTYEPLTLTVIERTRLVCFLFGNGSNEADIWVLVRHRLRDPSAQLHVRSLLKAVRGENKSKLYYFDVAQRDMVFMDGAPKGPAYGLQRARRMLNSWDKYVASHGDATLRMQESFLSQREVPDAHLFFALHAGHAASPPNEERPLESQR
jgi:hypothetical protein